MPANKNKSGLTEKEFLSRYDAGSYERPSVTVDTLIFTVANDKATDIRKLPQKELRLLLIKRADHPYLGQWALPGGFVKLNEDLESAAYRELAEETNISNIYMEQLFTWGDVERDPRTRVVSVSYLALVNSTLLDVKAGDDAEDARWFKVSCSTYSRNKQKTPSGYEVVEMRRLSLVNDEAGEITKLTAHIKISRLTEGNVTRVSREITHSSGIAFDHAKIAEYGIERLRNKIEWTDIAFSLMPPLFTLTELQQAYEVILDRKIHKGNFRRKISDMVIETTETRDHVGHRPSTLFRFNPNWAEENF